MWTHNSPCIGRSTRICCSFFCDDHGIYVQRDSHHFATVCFIIDIFTPASACVFILRVRVWFHNAAFDMDFEQVILELGSWRGGKEIWWCLFSTFFIASEVPMLVCVRVENCLICYFGYCRPHFV
ncbi:hypothetical protein PDE_02982 [Penicillium oxalicum 114-2]|uniref:Uncharacterized protein n=1 Tax=Penicillium oxalicum (strain 114-2 / CGMCC 5302) TaxID=933388 RepID=S8B122_PENO1|nr:hypothetical protein PDE_02982 [Penicillium oxalicum 114-2]